MNRVPIDWNTRSTVSDSAIKLMMAYAIGYNDSIKKIRAAKGDVLTLDEVQDQQEFDTAVQVLKGQLGIIVNSHGKSRERMW